MRGIGVAGCGAGLVASVLLALVSASPTLGIDAVAGQTGPTLVRTYDVRLVGSVTTTAPDVVWTEKATHTYRRVRIRFGKWAGTRVSVGLVETPRNLVDGTPNGVMRGQIAYQETGSTPCSAGKHFSGAARLDIHGSPGRSFYASGTWKGAPGGAELSRRTDCPGLVDVQGINHTWIYEKGRVFAQLNAGEATFGWLLSLRGQPFPVNRVYAGKSVTASVSGSMNDGFGVRKGSLRVTFTPRR